MFTIAPNPFVHMVFIILYKNNNSVSWIVYKCLGNSALENGDENDYNPRRTQGKEAKENMNAYTNVTVFEPEQASRFPNLLEDKDFSYYYWTLPVCSL